MGWGIRASLNACDRVMARGCIYPRKRHSASTAHLCHHQHNPALLTRHFIYMGTLLRKEQGPWPWCRFAIFYAHTTGIR